MDERGVNVLHLSSAQIGGLKREIFAHYSRLKLLCPSHIRSLTLREFREVGGLVDGNLHLPREGDEVVRSDADKTKKRTHITDAIRKLSEQNRFAVTTLYEQMKQQLPAEVLSKKMSDLDESDWFKLGIDIVQLSETLARRREARR